MNRRMGGAKNQVVVSPENIQLGNLIIIPRVGDQLMCNDGFWYFRPPTLNNNDNVWSPCYEANPINPFTALCRQDEESIANPFAIKLVSTFAKGSHSGGTVTGSSEAKGATSIYDKSNGC